MNTKIIGVHPIEADEPVHMIEIEIGNEAAFDWGKVTQEDDTQPEENWQVAWDEQPVPNKSGRWVFFFHYLDFKKPLLTSAGEMSLPAPTPVPTYLIGIRYESPG